MSEHLELLTTAEAADLLRLKKQSLRALRCRGGGPHFIRIGSPMTGRCLYRREDLDRWLTARVRTSTADERARLEAETRP